MLHKRFKYTRLFLWINKWRQVYLDRMKGHVYSRPALSCPHRNCLSNRFYHFYSISEQVVPSAVAQRVIIKLFAIENVKLKLSKFCKDCMHNLGKRCYRRCECTSGTIVSVGIAKKHKIECIPGVLISGRQQTIRRIAYRLPIITYLSHWKREVKSLRIMKKWNVRARLATSFFLKK